ncbi:MAG: DNA polymerase III subunit delta' [Hyphomicrobiales bacterium]
MSRRPAAAATRDDEFPLEPDRLDGFRHPRETEAFFGNGDAEARLLQAWNSGKLHHAWLLSGPAGLGKATLAYRFARFLLAQPGEGGGQAGSLEVDRESPAWRRIAARAHPNLLVLNRPWQEKSKKFASVITVDEVRRLRVFLGQTAGEGRWRCVIVDKADELNRAAVNALLKSLEEPPPYCVFLLVCEAPGRLPPTVRSRCQVLRLGPLGADDLHAAVKAALESAGRPAADPQRLEACMRLAGGSPGRTLMLLEQGGDALHGDIARLVSSAPHLDYAAVHKLADRLTASGADGSYELFFSLLGDFLASVIRTGSTGAAAGGPEAALAARLTAPGGLAKWAELWETVARMKAEADVLNLDRKNLILGTFFRVEETARASGL